MKRLIAVLFVVSMISSPCLAQVERESLGSIERTVWLELSFLYPRSSRYYGFYETHVYVSHGGREVSVSHLAMQRPVSVCEKGSGIWSSPN
jgi:hypothetical protein